MSDLEPQLCLNSVRYCSLPVKIRRFGQHQAVLCVLADRRRILVSDRVAQILRACRMLRTREAHEKEVSKFYGTEAASSRGSDSESRRIIADLILNGLIVSESSLPLIHQTRSRSTASATALRDIAVLTADRTSQLQSCITSILENAKGRSEPFNITVYDDTRFLSGNDRVLEVLRTFKQLGACTIRYCNRRSRSKYAELLAAESGVNRKVVDFALHGYEWMPVTTGASRNAALLDLAGFKLLYLDDDVNAFLFSSQDVKQEVVLDSNRHPVKFVPCDGMDTVMATLVQVHADILELHARHLGSPIQSLVFPLRDHVSTGCAPELWQSVLDGTGRISATQMGIVGHSGQSSPAWILSLTELERASLFKDDRSYEAARVSPYVARVADRLTISSAPFCMSYALGVDNEDSLPPFLPVGRNSDGVFGMALAVCGLNQYFGHLPFAVQHLKPRATSYSPDAIWHDSTRLRVSDIVIGILNEHESFSSVPEPTNRWKSLGARLCELSALSDCDFAEFLRIKALTAFSHRVVKYDALLEQYSGHPRLWSEDVNKAKQHIFRSVSTKDCGLPCDISLDDPRSRVRKTRELFFDFGNLLEAWSTLRQTAYTLRMRDGESCLSEPV